MSFMKYRKHIRLKGYDYATPNYYFVTVCTRNRQELFYPGVSEKYGDLLRRDVAAGLVPANELIISQRKSITNCIENILINEVTQKYSIGLDFYCIMPDHIHFIIVISGDHKGRSYSLGQIIGAFKSLSTREVWKLGYHDKIFQPNFYEHVVRNERSLDSIRQYILNNPLVQYGDIPWKFIDPT